MNQPLPKIDDAPGDPTRAADSNPFLHHAQRIDASVPSEEIVDAQLKRTIFEKMLTPQSLQIMMSAGGAMLAIGFAIWLWTLGVFANPLIAATAMGAVNLAVLGAGVFLVTQSRYKLAGRGLAFLSALLLPLHLWFYNAQGLIVLAQGDHLWIPALLICGLYALVARLTRDSVFVYQLVGGIVLTGLLFLAGPQMAFLWPIIPTCMFLVLLGTIAIQFDRFFVEPQGAFSRDEFGKAFFRAGHVTVLVGLAYLFVGQVAETLLGGWMVLENWSIGNIPEINLWSLPVLVVACWAYVFSHISRGKQVGFAAAACGVSIWFGFTTLHVLAIPLTTNLILLLVAMSMVAIQIVEQVFAKTNNRVGDARNQSENPRSEVAVSFVNSALALASYGQAVYILWTDRLADVTPVFLAQGLLVALSNSVRTDLILGERNSMISQVRLMVAGFLVSLFGVLSLMQLAGLGMLASTAILLGIVAGLLLLVQVLNLGRSQRSLMELAQGWLGGTAVVFFTGFVQGSIIFGSLPAIGIVLTAGICLLYIGLVSESKGAMVASAFTFAIAACQIAVLLNITSAYSIILGISMIGMISMLAVKVYEYWIGKRGPKEESISASLGMQIANIILAAGAVASILFVGFRILPNKIVLDDCGLLLFQFMPLALAYGMNRLPSWRQAVASLALLTLVMFGVSFVMAAAIPIVYRIELLVLGIGAALLAAGHLGWYREQEALDGTDSASERANITARFADVSIHLGVGSLMIALPMIVGMMIFRFFDVESDSFWKSFHEIGGLAAGLLMLGSGILCKIRSTTISGFATLSAFLVSLVGLIRVPDALQSVSVMMMIGGGLFFAAAILLSIYREWVLGLPAKIKVGEGVFKVLKWR